MAHFILSCMVVLTVMIVLVSCSVNQPSHKVFVSAPRFESIGSSPLVALRKAMRMHLPRQAYTIPRPRQHSPTQREIFQQLLSSIPRPQNQPKYLLPRFRRGIESDMELDDSDE